ncbi:MAG: TetR/AcrR family transcriptional regulator [Gammaproteobacteria bacterium]|jgi:TetR/AcrR family transcriptional regulator|nr:TetR/AcrR family transcriptional regulator [Gammaproteobacteria bacterium]
MARPVATETRDKILDCAEACFISRGFSATTMREIARAADTTTSLIVHHFGSKKKLWETVKQRRMQGFIEQQQALLQQPKLDLSQFLQSIRDYYQLLRDDPQLVQLLARAELEQDIGCSRFQQELVTAFVARISAAQQQNVFRQDINPAYLLAVILCATTQWMEARHQFTNWHEMADDENPDDAFLETLIEVMINGVKPIAGASS